ncbi:MAG: single-stranded DNA-binding protein [Bacteroidales bacterium]
MQKSLNKVELRGHVGQDPKMIHTENGGTVIHFAIATNEVYKGKDDKYCEDTIWHNVAAWSIKGMPDFSKIKKGTYLELIGKIRYVKYKAPGGEERTITEILALKIIIPLAE